MDELVARIRAALDKTEQIALGVVGEHWNFEILDDGKRAFEENINSDWVLRQVAKDRKILAAHPIDMTRRTKTGEPWFGCRCWLDRDGDVTFGPQLLCEIIPPLAEAYGIEVPTDVR